MATCSQQLRVVTEGGEGITGAKVTGAGKTAYSGYMGYTAIVAEKGSKHNVTASHVLYGSKTYSCTWNCDNTWLLVLKRTAPEDCTQRFKVADESGKGIPYAKVSGAGKTTTADGTGEARIQAEKGSKHNVTASRTGYETKTYSCEWKCDNIWRLTLKKSVAEYGKFKIRVRDFKTGGLINDANVCMKASGSSIGCKKTSNGVTDWFSNIKLDKHITGIISKTGYVNFEIKGFDISRYNGDTLTCSMLTKEQIGKISVTSKQSGVTIHVDGYNMGTAPVVVENLLAGKHSARAMKTGYITQYVDVDVTAGETKKVYFDLNESTNGEAKSAYKVVVSGIPPGKTFKVEAFAESAVHLWEKDPNKTYSATKDQNEARIYRDDMGGSPLKDYKKHEHKIKLFSDTGVLLSEKTERALRADNDILVVNMIAGEGKRWRINFTYSKNPQANKPFDVRAALIEAPGIPALRGMEVQFYEIIEGAPVELTKRNLTNDYGIAIRHVEGRPEGEYIFDAEYVHGDTQREPVTVVVGEEKPPSELLAFLKPVVDWVMTTFGMSEDERGTAETYTYIGLGFIAVAVLGGFMK